MKINIETTSQEICDIMGLRFPEGTDVSLRVVDPVQKPAEQIQPIPEFVDAGAAGYVSRTIQDIMTGKTGE